MEPRTKKGLYTIIYPFMANVLNLAGLAKECFAIIFGFWFAQNQRPVPVSLTTMQTITGGTRPAVVQAVHRLEDAGLIKATRTPGKKTNYDVNLPEQTLADFKELYANKRLDKSLNPQEYAPTTSTSSPRLSQNKKNANHESVITPLRVKPANEIRSTGLKEA